VGRATIPRGNLGDWLIQHHNLPVQDQERMLRSDPGFNRLPAQEQQRLDGTGMHQVENYMPAQRRDQTLARAEMISSTCRHKTGCR